ncbi:hypothetical protein BDV06DRAFT_220072 [Aspergillus oleicola]
MVPAIIILSWLYFTPDSPRWLISKNRKSDALKSLEVFRSKKAIDEGLCELEMIASENSDNRSEKAPWKALFNASNRRRISIAMVIMSLQHLMGVTFSSSYGLTFYKIGSIINNGVSVVTAMLGMYKFDVFGRRDLTFHGCWGQAPFLCLIGGLGAKSNRSTSATNGMVASFILYAAILHATLGPAALNVVIGFAVVYSTPYLLSTAGANLGARLGYVWGGCAFFGAIWVWFFMPEVKGRSLENIDELFAAGLPDWRFKGYECTGLSGGDLARIRDRIDEENHVKDEDKGERVELEDVKL